MTADLPSYPPAADALFVPDGASYVGTLATQGGWDPAAANGGAVLALLGQCLDDVPTLTPMEVSRFTADLVRPVPIGKPLDVSISIVREGKKIQVVQLILTTADAEHVRATALRMRAEPVEVGDLRSSTDDRPADRLVPVDACAELTDHNPEAPGFLRAIEMRQAPVAEGAGSGWWVRLAAPVVAGQPTSPTARLAVTFDFANLINLPAHSAALTMINPDVTAHVLRQPREGWFAVTGETRVNPQWARGVSTAALSDADGVFAYSSTSQLLQT